MDNSKLNELYKKYKLGKNEIYQHKHYTIITRQGIDKIQAVEKININYDVIKCEKDYCVVKATAKVDDYIIQTFGSALHGEKYYDDKAKKWKETGTTQSWYIMEMAEKRAMSRAVLKLTGFYELGVFSECESEDFKQEEPPKQEELPKVKNMASLIKYAIKENWSIADVKKTRSITTEQEETIKAAITEHHLNK
jgi:hypothetical protein